MLYETECNKNRNVTNGVHVRQNLTGRNNLYVTEARAAALISRARSGVAIAAGRNFVGARAPVCVNRHRMGG